MKESITPREQDYSQWYLDVIDAADLAEHGPVRGTMIIKPNGYSLWEKVQSVLDARFKELDVQNVYFPMFIPQSFLMKEEKHVEGFAPEVALVTKAGGKDLEEPLVVRPTSETIINNSFSKWIRSHRDLPMTINQWANVVRWEMRPRLFLRTTEFLWQEGHTAHTTVAEADEYARQMLDVYKNFVEDYMAIPVIPGAKSPAERFAGAQETYTIEAMMQDGKALQFATSHNLGENFAKVFDIQYLDESENKKYVGQTSWGISTRSIGGLIMTHSDDKGLVLPPKMASVHAVIVPIYKTEDERQLVMNAATTIKERVRTHTIKIDDRENMTPGNKFYHWEARGIPIRIEIGPRDIKEDSVVFVRRDNGMKEPVAMNDIETKLGLMLENMQGAMFEKAQQRLHDNTVVAETWEQFKEAIEEGKFVLAHWSGDEEDELKIKEETKATIRCLPFGQPIEEGVCVYSGKPSRQKVLFARSY